MRSDAKQMSKHGYASILQRLFSRKVVTHSLLCTTLLYGVDSGRTYPLRAKKRAASKPTRAPLRKGLKNGNSYCRRTDANKRERPPHKQLTENLLDRWPIVVIVVGVRRISVVVPIVILSKRSADQEEHHEQPDGVCRKRHYTPKSWVTTVF